MFEKEAKKRQVRKPADSVTALMPEQSEGEAPLDFVISMNLKRRHLNESQKAAISLAALPLFEKEAKKRMEIGRPKEGVALMPQDNKGKAREKAAVLFDVSPRYIQLAKKLQREHPELLD